MQVGIDVERLDRAVNVDLLAARCFSDSEVAALGRSGSARTYFVELWTLKEAFLKAAGSGLSQPLHSASFDVDETLPLVHFSAPTGFNASEWHFALYSPRPETRLAAGVHNPAARKIRWQAHDYDSRDSVAAGPVRTTG
jgi:4'-phosphopantetheinyl transferase